MAKEHKNKTLEASQTAFASILLDGENTLAPSYINPHERLSVYQNNYQKSLMNCLQSTFIQTKKIIGDVDFDKYALTYMDKFPSEQENLNIYGDNFSNYLKRERASIIAVDLATYDYLRMQCYYAENHNAFDVESFMNASETQQISSYFIKPASMMVLTSDYSITEIINSSTFFLSDIKSSSATNCYLLYRALGKVKLKIIEEYTFLALKFFSQSRCLKNLDQVGLAFFSHLLELGYLALSEPPFNEQLNT